MGGVSARRYRVAYDNGDDDDHDVGLAELHYPHDVIDVASADALTDAGDDHDDDED